MIRYRLSNSDIQGSFFMNFHFVRPVWCISSTIQWLEMELTLVGSETPYPWKKNVSMINRSTKRTQRLTNQCFFPFKTNGRKCNFEWIHGIINSGKLKAHIFGRVLSFFWPRKLHKSFFWKYIFSNFERGIITCFIDALFRLFTILCFLKNRHNPGWSVRTLDQYTDTGLTCPSSTP